MNYSKSIKGLFGYRGSIARLINADREKWFDPSRIFISVHGVLTNDSQDRPKLWIGKLIVLMFGALLIVRLSQLQITESAEHRYLAEGNRIRRQITIAPRGAILDRKGLPLVTNEAGYSLDIVPSDLPREKQDRYRVFEIMSKALDIPVDNIIRRVDQAGLTSLEPITLQANLQREQALAYKVKYTNLSGVRVSFVPTRRYDSTPGLAHILGYTSRLTDRDIANHPNYHQSSPIGRAGVESSYDSLLRGHEGANEVEVNASGQLQRTLHNDPPKVGSTLKLTVDQGLQVEMSSALKEAIDNSGSKRAIGIAMDPVTGGILASVSIPSYDNNLFSRGISPEAYESLNTDPDKPLLNRAVDGLYPAGSTIKPFVAAAALQEKTITPKTSLDTSVGVIKIGQWEFPDWKVHGVTDVRQAIAESNDIFFYSLGGGWDKIPGLGVERLKKYFTIFGFGNSTGVDYASDQRGLVPDQDWKKRVKKENWYIGDTYHVAIGQGNLLITPLQLARGLSSLVNGGRLLTPHVVESVEESNTGKVESLSYAETKLPISSDAIATVKEGMRMSVSSDTGSARSLKSLPFSSGGKTGTAQFGNEEKTHAWYMGFAPYDSPKIVVVILVEGGGEGNVVAVPVASRVMKHYMAHQ